MNDKLQELREIGQSIWLDFIRRSFLLQGKLAELVNQGLGGVTSNPSIFEKAIAQSDDYDEQLEVLSRQQLTPQEIYEAMAIRDIQTAADTLRTVYARTDGADGYVSLEVNPNLAHDTEGTIDEARRLFKAVNRPNVMIKVPATAEGIPAIETLIGEGVNVNVTLMFSLDQYDAVAEAYLSGLEALAESGGDVSRIGSVASFFVSRVDVMVDTMLDELDAPEAKEIKGTIGIANAKMAYQRFQETFSGERWERLAAQGARYQRVLWASTSTKDPAYPDTLYSDNLIGPHTVNTLPPDTLDAFLDHGTVATTVTEDLAAARAHLETLDALGIDLDRVTDDLLDEGVEKFARPFASLMDSIEAKCRRMTAEETRLEMALGEAEDAVDAALEEMAAAGVMARIWDYDYTVWKPQPTEISNRLGWLHIPAVMRRHVGHINDLVNEVRDAGYTDVLLLGMGGSSLAPEVFSEVFGEMEEGLDLAVLDSTDPGAVLGYDQALDLSKTLFIVASKSGSTAETLSFFKYFYNRVVEELGEDAAGEHFIAITDPGSNLVSLGERYRFRTVFENDPTLGGRYSALSFFGLVPAALVGVDLARLLDRAVDYLYRCPACSTAGSDAASRLGAAMGELAKLGRDKLTLVTSPAIAAFGDWVEQLIAESTGKSGTGILPVVGEPLGSPEVYGDDRLFVQLTLAGDELAEAPLTGLRRAGHPVVSLEMADRYDLGAQMVLWELAVAVAGHRLGIQPFNQPNVESAKVQARKMIAAYKEKGALPEGESTPVSAAALHDFLAQAEAGDYIALQAFVTPDERMTEALVGLRLQLRNRYSLATTVGYGPRFLHSTGQLHKGDAGGGLFIQLTATPARDAPIPDEAGDPASSLTFDVLKTAQALGDRQALLDAGRRVIHFHLGEQPVETLQKLMGAVRSP